MRRLLVVLAAALPVLGWVSIPYAAAEPAANAVTVELRPAKSSVRLGESLDLRIIVTNHGTSSTSPLVVHLDITDPTRSTSVDPEDWTSTLSKRVEPLAAGHGTTVRWTVLPISSGTFAAYAVALAPGADKLATSNVLQVVVTGKRALNPGGILLVAIGMPCLVGALLTLQVARTRRRRGALARAAGPLSTR
jgi:uncharacterized membrane protein